MLERKYCSFFIILTIIQLVSGRLNQIQIGQPGSVLEFCGNSAEEHQLQCSPNEVIIIEMADYGDFKDGGCDVSSINRKKERCVVSVIDKLDKICSGKQICRFIPPTTDVIQAYESRNNCPDELKAFRKDLRVIFRCLSVVETPCSPCRDSPFMVDTKRFGDSASLSAFCEDSCPTSVHLVTSQRRQFNLTLLDFGWDSDNSGECDQPFSQVRDGQRKISVCQGGNRRRHHIITSSANSLHIEIIKRKTPYRFLFEYHVFGCKLPPMPANSRVKTTKDGIVIECLTSDHKFELICVGSSWVGMLGDCRAEPKSQTSSSKPISTTATIILVICAAIIIAFVIPTSVLYVVNRRMRRSLQKEYAFAQPCPSNYTKSTTIYTTRPAPCDRMDHNNHIYEMPNYDVIDVPYDHQRRSVMT
ncbi:DgyrCDS3304 [Dimorphilus gyrociliatus]|uniref:DgyrCDS3304 n=1 Tax=Dimorphilus gyrociliatus TaxID=2664684 RepID=A0A7I8VDX6_9ANNE|nr:DgyrCDS3304 [Dimorphilus gyrociliatus]